MSNPAAVTTPPSGTSPANPAVPPATPAPEPKKESVSKQLFPDFYNKDGELQNGPDPEFGKTPPAAAPAPASPQPPTPAPAPATPAPDYLDLAQMSGKRVKLKVDGREVEATVDELVKNHQLDAHLTQKAQRLADKEKEVKVLMDELLDKPRLTGDDDPPAPPAPGKVPAKAKGETQEEYVKRLEDRLSRLESGMATVHEVTKDQRIQQGFAALDAKIKADTGLTDFMEFVPQIKEFIFSQVKDPAHPTREELYYDTPEFFKSKYLELKIKAVNATPTPPATPAPAAPATPATPPAPATPVVKVEPGGGTASGASTVDDWQTRYDAAFEKAVQSGSRADWAEVSKLKHEPH